MGSLPICWQKGSDLLARDPAVVAGRASHRSAVRGNDLQGEWRAPPRFDSLYLGFERYADSANDQNLWIDDVALSKARVGCLGMKKKGGDR
jgi:hypothetical protein